MHTISNREHSRTMNEIMAAGTYEVVGQIFTCVVDSIIDESGYDAFPRDAHFPQTGDVHHVCGEIVVDEVPLVGK
jgi:hypothetical protein